GAQPEPLPAPNHPRSAEAVQGHERRSRCIDGLLNVHAERRRSSDGDSESCRNERPSEDLLDHVNRSVGADLSGADGKQPVQEGVLRLGSLEARHCTKVASSWRSVVTDPLERHVDERAVVRLERKPQVELEDAVSPEERPVTATGKDLSTQARALEVTARYRRGDARSVRNGSDLLYIGRVPCRGRQ